MSAPEFVPVCALAEIKNGSHKAVEIEGIPVLLVRLNQQVHALHNRCTHLDFSLDGGRQVGWELMCRKHGARFDVRDGRALLGRPVFRGVGHVPRM